jgi:hypothetical protein
MIPVAAGSYLYFHTSGAGNTGYITLKGSKRNYVMTLAAATANAYQFFTSDKITSAYISTKCAAAGAIEISTTGTTQLSTGTPDVSVRARVDIEPVTTSGLPQQNYQIDL